MVSENGRITGRTGPGSVNTVYLIHINIHICVYIVIIIVIVCRRVSAFISVPGDDDKRLGGAKANYRVRALCSMYTVRIRSRVFFMQDLCTIYMIVYMH